MTALKNFFEKFQNKTEKAKKQLQSMGLEASEAEFLRAATTGNAAALPLLLEAGINPNAKDEQSRNAAALASMNGHVGLISVLATSGCNLNQPDRDGNSPLIHAIHAAQMECAKALIQASVNVDVRDNEGMSAVMLSVLAGHYAILESLINAGADVNVKNHESGQTALMMAADRGSYDMSELLLKNAITSEDRDAQDRKGATALLYAARKGHTEVVRLLCTKKANVNLADKEGNTPIKTAANAEVAKILADHGAK